MLLLLLRLGQALAALVACKATRAATASRLILVPDHLGPAAHAHDIEDYKNRNVFERFFNRMRNWRGLASRYDKHALVYRGGVVLAAILDWLT